MKSDFYCFLYLNDIIEFLNKNYIHRTDFHFNFIKIKDRRLLFSMTAFQSVNFTISLGLQSNILHSFSIVKSVIFLFFLRESSVLLSMLLLSS